MIYLLNYKGKYMVYNQSKAMFIQKPFIEISEDKATEIINDSDCFLNFYRPYGIDIDIFESLVNSNVMFVSNVDYYNTNDKEAVISIRVTKFKYVKHYACSLGIKEHEVIAEDTCKFDMKYVINILGNMYSSIQKLLSFKDVQSVAYYIRAVGKNINIATPEVVYNGDNMENMSKVKRMLARNGYKMKAVKINEIEKDDIIYRKHTDYVDVYRRQ